VLAACGSVCPVNCTVGEYEAEYSALLERVVDRSGLQAIKLLHSQLDDDNDGTIEPAETGDFIKADLKFDGDRRREKIFHDKDAEITVADLWVTWTRSEVYNWTVEQTVDWLSYSIELPQYAPSFRQEQINGSSLPLLAANNDPTFLSKRLGITNPIHKSKISLKAMDVVLFGPPKEPSNLLKDMMVALLLILLLSALTWAYHQKKKSEQELTKMMKDMESLTKAEQMLKDMQIRVDKAESSSQQYNHLVNNNSSQNGGVAAGEEVGRLREEVEILRGELHRAEIELEDRCWVAPTILQHWLQLTYELECKFFNDKRRAAENQMETAKDACEKLKRKRSSIVGAFVSTHGRSIDDVDKSILEAKTALLELTHDLTERSRRWRQIEMLTGVSIISNPGLVTLQKIVRYVGGGSKSGSVRGGGSAGGGMSSRMSNMSLDELGADDDARSLAASSHVSSVTRSSKARFSGGSGGDSGVMRRAAFQLSRQESSKESASNSESDDQVAHKSGTGVLKSRISQTSMASDISRYSQNSASSTTQEHAKQVAVVNTAVSSRPTTPPPSVSSSSASLRRTRMMHKSLSHGEEDMNDRGVDKLTSSVSDSALNSNVSTKTAAPSITSKLHQSTLDEIEESCSASDSGSLYDLEGKKKKKKSFFNFRRKKDKVETIS